ncbi:MULTISPECIES: LysE family translocator [Shewanella]|uniref:LysE family translocator n=1 Tax=Shewanella TaxID=22 RepID=UPI00177EA6ED|nr:MULTISPECIES: LysE family translocator [Shewanella]
MDFALLSTLAVIHSLALISPGPDFAIIVKTATQQPRRIALMCAFGISLAILIHSLLSLLGISLMIRQSEFAYFAVQIIGACYLAWMGFGALSSALSSFKKNTKNEEKNFSEPSSFEHETQDKAPNQPNSNDLEHLTFSSAKGFKIGLYTNLLNPKALIFFITIFTVLVTPQVTLATKVASASLLFTLSLCWFSFLAIILTKPQIQHKMAKGSLLIDAITGIIFMGVSITILTNLINQLIV